MKKAILVVLIACLCLAVWGGAALGEADETARMSAEALWDAAKEAEDAGEQQKAVEYYRQAVELGDVEAGKRLEELAEAGLIQEK
ncbi:MAG: hypothetical protein IJH09_04880 [Clostridia bacterium]|nr:hypothetical protein [Clostridia bacterium]